MPNINIAQTLVGKRAEKGITQDELAKFIGVSKASVCKWEKGHSYPDITFLPKLAAYFDISLDELMGYASQMTAENIHQLLEELKKDFATQPFDEVMDRCQHLIKKYYSCFPLIFQIGMLFVNYNAICNDEEKKPLIIAEAKQIFVRVKTLSDDIHLKRLSLQFEAFCETMLGNPKEVISLLSDERRYSLQPSPRVMLAQSYQMLEQTLEAKLTLQDGLLDSVIMLFYDITAYLSICKDDANHFEEICKRAMAISEVFNIKTVYSLAMPTFYLTAADGYLSLGNTGKALDMLENYAEVITGDFHLLTVHGDAFFTLIDSLQEKYQREGPLGLADLYCDEGSVKQALVDAVVHEECFAALRKNKRYQKVEGMLRKMV